VTGNVYFAAGAKFRVDVDKTSSSADLLAVTGTVSGAGSPVQVSVTSTGTGPWKIMMATNITATFTTDAAGQVLTKKNGNTELWIGRSPRGTIVEVR